MIWQDITLENIGNFISGNIQRFKDNLGLLPKHEQEQVLFRATQCPKECAINGKCFFCKCDYPEKLYVRYSCNKNKALPDLMGEQEWEIYKTKLKIEDNNDTEISKTSN